MCRDLRPLAPGREARAAAAAQAGIAHGLDDLVPVSYTHLDVYKRQAYASAPDLTPQGGSYRNLDDFLALFGGAGAAHKACLLYTSRRRQRGR